MARIEKWYEKVGDCSDVVCSTRVRLARNLRSYPFPAHASGKQKEEIAAKIREALLSGNSILADTFSYLPLENLTEEEAVSLVERHIVSPEFISDRRGKAILISADESVSIMINEEDHLRIQILREGLSLKGAAEMADRIDTLLGESLDFAFDSELGYLTQCPTNLGTGMRASLMLHLPSLQQNGMIKRISDNLSKLGLTLRGTYGEGTEPVGALYQLSNQVTLGLSEKEAIENLERIVMQLVEEERNIRKSLMENMKKQDAVARSLGILKSAKILSTEEFMKLLSNVRLGVASGFIKDISYETLNKLMIQTQPATMMTMKGKQLSAEERDILRASMVSEGLK